MATPACRIEPLNLMFRIPTEQFMLTGNSSQRTYTTDIRVDEQSDYPDIPASTWTVTVEVGDEVGEVTASVSPKHPQSDLRCSSNMAVVYKVMWCQKDTVGLLGDIQIGPGGYSDVNAGDLVNLAAQLYFVSSRKTLYELRKNALVLVHLIFYAKKSTARADLKELLSSGTLSDCTLVCDGQDFPAHRAILAAQSPVFTAMFQNDMKEKASGVCKIDGITKDVLQTVLQFAYTRAPIETGMCGKLEELWSAADKYDMEDLRAECEKVMIGCMDADVALKYLCFALQHKLKKLTTEAAKFIGKNPEETLVDL